MQSPLSIALLAVRTIDSAFHDSGIDPHVTKPLDPLFLPALTVRLFEGRRPPS